MTLNQKIFAISSLSIFVLILFIAGGVVLEKMVSKGGITKPPAPSPSEESSNPENITEEETPVTEEAVVAESDGSQDAPAGKEEAAVEENIGWQTYSNDFYAVDYPVNYKISGQNRTTGDLNFQISGFGSEAVIFISSGKKALAFQGAWSVIAPEEATGQKLLDTENIDMNGIRFEKNYWAIRQVENGAWLTVIVYYGCGPDGACFSLLRGVTAKGITAWPELSGDQLADKTKVKTLVSVIKSSKETDTINFNNMFLTFRFNEKVTTAAAVSDSAKATSWKEYILEPLVNDPGSLGSTDRKLVGIRDDGTKEVITESVKTTMDWNNLPGFYPNKVLFPPYAKEIYLTKYLSDSGSSAGMFALDVPTLKYRRLANVGKIYEDYNNYASIISPDKKLIASLGGSDLYILDLAADKATVIATANEGEILNPAGPGSEYKWIDNSTVQYPVYKNSVFSKPAEVRKATVK